MMIVAANLQHILRAPRLHPAFLPANGIRACVCLRISLVARAHVRDICAEVETPSIFAQHKAVCRAVDQEEENLVVKMVVIVVAAVPLEEAPQEEALQGEALQVVVALDHHVVFVLLHVEMAASLSSSAASSLLHPVLVPATRALTFATLLLLLPAVPPTGIHGCVVTHPKENPVAMILQVILTNVLEEEVPDHRGVPCLPGVQVLPA